MGSDDEQPRVATVELTNDAWTDEIQRLIGLLEKEFFVDAQMADGKLHVIRELRGSTSSSESQEGESMSLDERREYVDELLERLRQSDRDIADGRTSTLDEVREELDGDESDDAEEPERSETSEEPTEDESGVEEDDRPTCQYCDEAFHPKGLKPHQRHYPENPANDDPDEQDVTGSETRCPYCNGEYTPKGLGPHKRHCPENPENRDDTDAGESDSATGKSGASPASSSTGDREQDSASSDDDSGDGESDCRYRCGGCGKRLPTRRGVQNHQNRSRDCTGADIERVEQTDDSETAASAADPSGDDENDQAEEEADDADLDPEVGAVPIDPDTVDAAVVEDDEPVPADEPDEDDKHRVRREPSTVREVVDGPAGRYLCLNCGFTI